jgi:DNA polymerase-3 subunit epsilon
MFVLALILVFVLIIALAIKSQEKPQKELKEIIKDEPTMEEFEKISQNFRSAFPGSYNYDFIAFDFETATGSRDSACQLGFVCVKNGEIVERFNYFIQPPGNEYSEFNIRIHGITPEKTKNSPTFDKIWPKIRPYFESNLIVAHNISFDLSVLRGLIQYYNLPTLKVVYDCTYALTGLNLKKATARYDVKLVNHHDGLADAEACALIYLAVKNGGIRTKDKPKEKIEYNVEYFKDKRVVFTGEFYNIDRDEISAYMKEHGVKVTGSISRLTNYVIIGERPGYKKLEKLEELTNNGYNIEPLDENELLKLLNIK